MITAEITLRSVQHYLYCPHRWGLIEIDRAWAENAYVTKANLLHERVHDPEANYISRGKKVFTSVPVYNDREEYNLYGVVDSLELTKDVHGISSASWNISRQCQKTVIIAKTICCRCLRRKSVWTMCLEEIAAQYCIMQMSEKEFYFP